MGNVDPRLPLIRGDLDGATGFYDRINLDPAVGTPGARLKKSPNDKHECCMVSSPLRMTRRQIGSLRSAASVPANGRPQQAQMGAETNAATATSVTCATKRLIFSASVLSRTASAT